MVNSIQELREAIEKENVIRLGVQKVLLELDTTPSVTTQASLNDMLVELYERVKASKDMKIETEAGENLINAGEFIAWVRDNFTEYSYEMFLDTIG